MDWGSAADWVSACANVVVAILAWFALGTWRRETVGRRNIEIAEDALVRIRTLADGMKKARKTYILPPREMLDYTFEDRVRDAQEVSDKVEALKPEMVTLEAHMHVVRPRLGREAQYLLTEMLELAWRMSALGMSLSVPGRRIKDDEEAVERVLFRWTGDKIDGEIDALVKRADRILGAYIGSKL